MKINLSRKALAYVAIALTAVLFGGYHVIHDDYAGRSTLPFNRWCL